MLNFRPANSIGKILHINQSGGWGGEWRQGGGEEKFSNFIPDQPDKLERGV